MKEEIVSAADANRSFSRLLHDVRQGRSYIVTSHGKPVARISPVEESDKKAEVARDILLARLLSQPAVEVGKWTRDELYEDDE
jgi:prevent-host-death family protein